jgi:hypothetical protein
MFIMIFIQNFVSYLFITVKYRFHMATKLLHNQHFKWYYG